MIIFTGSHITKAWKSFMDEIEHTAKQFKTNAEALETLCQDRITQLYQDKRKARKTYQEEHNKIATHFTHVSNLNGMETNYQFQRVICLLSICLV